MRDCIYVILYIPYVHLLTTLRLNYRAQTIQKGITEGPYKGMTASNTNTYMRNKQTVVVLRNGYRASQVNGSATRNNPVSQSQKKYFQYTRQNTSDKILDEGFALGGSERPRTQHKTKCI